MKTRFYVRRLVVIVGLLALVIAGSLSTPLPQALADSGTPWHGEYYNSVNLSGTPMLVREDASISFDWGASSPGAGVNAEGFSVRWTNFVSFAGGSYTFRVTVDDGARLWVDEQLLIDAWYDQSAKTYTASKTLTAGYHSLRLEYYEKNGDALIKLGWDTGNTTTITDWRGEYYNNTTLSGTPTLVRNDIVISFNWGSGAPAQEINADNFSVRWTRQIAFASSGNYVFSVTSDDGVRVWVGSTLVIDRWQAQSRTTHSATIYVAAGTHQVKVEYLDLTGLASCAISWAAATPATPVATSEVIVDDLDAHFVRSGLSTGWSVNRVGYKSHLYWAWNSISNPRVWAKWFPYVPTAGNWEVYVYIPGRFAGTRSARYIIYHNGARNDRALNQGAYYDRWVSLGTYYFAGGVNEYVYLSDATGEASRTRFVGFDAVKFVRRDDATPPPSSGCSILPVQGFGRVWSGNGDVRSKLGCATQVEDSIWAGEQAFQGGLMLWRQGTKTIWVLYNNGTWQSYDETWSSSDPEWDTSIVPPSGYYQPKRGFGKVWRDNPSLRAALGWAKAEERGFFGTQQPFANGRMFWSNQRGIFVLYNDGKWVRGS